MSFGYRTQFLVDHTKVNSNLADFPVLIALNDARFKSVGNGGHVQSANGYDIRFYADPTPSLARDYELVEYNASTGTGEFWVRCSSCSNVVDTEIDVLYGDTSLTTDGSGTATWKSAYLGVWHYPNGSTLSYKESTSNAKTATGSGTPTAGAAQVGGGIVLNGTNQHSSHTVITISGAFSVSYWAKQTNHTGAQMGYSDTSESDKIGTNGTAVFVRVLTNADQTITAPSTGAWHYFKVTRDGSNICKLSIDGAAYSTLFSGAAQSNNTQWKFHGGLSQWFGGTLDEIRLSTDADNIDWTNAEYLNQTNPATFAVMGTEVNLSASIIPILMYHYRQRAA